MINEGAYKSWLEQNGAQTEPARNVRTYAIRTIERNLAALSLPYADLEEAFKADKFVALRARLKQMRADARSGGQDYRILMPDSVKPMGRLASWGSWLGQYGRFLGGEAPKPTKDADLIRQYVFEHYIEPAREDGLIRSMLTSLPFGMRANERARLLVRSRRSLDKCSTLTSSATGYRLVTSSLFQRATRFSALSER